MAAFDPATLDRWRALAIVDRDGTTVGTISEFYLDRETGYPTWALVNTGLFGATQTFVPLVQATEISDGLQVPYAKSHIKDAPRLDRHDELTPSDEATLFAHYGVAYEPSPDQPEPTPVEGPGPVPAQPGPAEAQAEAQPGPAETPGPVPAQPLSAEAPGSSPAGSESSASADVMDARSESVPPEPTGTIPAEPGTDEVSGARGSSVLDLADGAVPDEPGTADPDQATRVDQQGLRAEGLEPDELGAASPPGEARAEADLSRTAPVEPGLPGSTATSPYGPPTTIDKAAEQPARPPEEVAWPPGPAGSFEEQVPLDRPAGSSDRWREATQPAEPEGSARAASPPPEERSPLERARRRLERLVGVGQEPTDPEEISPTDRDAAERARRNRLDLGEDDDRRR
jgi:PRC-barrel domain